MQEYLEATKNSKDLAGNKDQLDSTRYNYMVGQVGKHVETMIVQVSHMVTVNAAKKMAIWMRQDIKAAIITIVSGKESQLQ